MVSSNGNTSGQANGHSNGAMPQGNKQVSHARGAECMQLVQFSTRSLADLLGLVIAALSTMDSRI